MQIIQQSMDYERGGTQKDVYAEDEVASVPCPYCGSEDRERVYTEHGCLGVSKCKQCSLIYTSPRITAPEQVYWGEGEKYYSESRLIFSGKAKHHRDPNYLEELRLIERYKKPGRFLDVGCNMGFLLRHARQRGWNVVGVEPSESLARIAIEKSGLTVHNCFLNEVPGSEEGSFDVVALSDVFEHITEPLPFLKDASRFMAPDGILYIKVPNARWNLFKQRILKLFGRSPRQGLWDSYEHVVHYTDESLRRMLDRAGFEVLQMTIGKPIQIPVWHHKVGHYYQYPSPWWMDWKRYTARSLTYWLSKPERLLRGGSVGALAPNIAVIARKKK